MAAAVAAAGTAATSSSVDAFRIDDLAAATFTPYKFGADGKSTVVDLAQVDSLAADLAAHGVRWAFINGTTGDSMSLTTPERKALAESWVAAGRKHGVRIVNHIGAASIADSVELAAHAEAVGCDAISAMPPFFFKPSSPRIIAEWLRDIGAAAPKMPLYYYHFSVITGVFVDPLALIKAIEEVGVPTFRGMKFTDFNLWHYSNCVRHAGGRYDMVYGRDESMLGGLATGAKASIGNAFNFVAGVYQRLRRAFFAGDLETARMEQGRACDIVNMMNDAKYGGNALSISRAIYEMKGAVKLGPVRAPHKPLTEAQLTVLRKDLDAIGFFTWCD